ncbi:MAG: hypothetical protein AAF732_08325, partial [Pseudomonadota bacterium]
RRIFLDPTTRAAQDDWESIARFLVATFRAETARLGEDKRAQALIAELDLGAIGFSGAKLDATGLPSPPPICSSCTSTAT